MAKSSRLTPTELGPAYPVARFARHFGVHPSTVWRQLKAGKLKSVRVGGREFVLLENAEPVVRSEPSN